jgi:hypothetical protein
MATINLTIKIKRAWWLRPYLYGVLIFSYMTGMQPDFEKVARTAARGFKVDLL